MQLIQPFPLPPFSSANPSVLRIRRSDLSIGLFSKLNKSSGSITRWNFDEPDHLSGDLSWPGPCIENLTAGADATHAPAGPPLLVHPVGANNGDLALLRPRRWWHSNGNHVDRRDADSSGAKSADDRDEGKIPNGTTNGNKRGTSTGRGRGEEHKKNGSKVSAGDKGPTATPKGERLALDSGYVRQVSAVMPTSTHPPQVFARCDYSVTLVELRGDLDLFRRQEDVVHSSLPLGGSFGDSYPGVLGGFRAPASGLTAVEKLVFARRLTCTACSPYTRAHAAFLDEDFRLFTWHPNRGAVMHGSGPLQFPALVLDGECSGVSAVTRARRAQNAHVSLDYGHHPRVLWMAGQYKAYRVDLREPPSLATLAPALDLGVYFHFSDKPSIVNGGSGGFDGRGEPPKIRALAVGRQSVHDVFVGAGLQLACMDDRFPRDAVAR